MIKDGGLTPSIKMSDEVEACVPNKLDLTLFRAELTVGSGRFLLSCYNVQIHRYTRAAQVDIPIIALMHSVICATNPTYEHCTWLQVLYLSEPRKGLRGFPLDHTFLG